MKRKYSTLPESMSKMEMFGFHWMEFVTQIPSPLYIITSYKNNGLSNACMQSWTTFTGGKNGFYAIVSAVSKYGHLYQTLHETKEAVINFMSADIYDKCMSTIRHNQFDDDEIAKAGLASIKADMVNAPMIEECFINLELNTNGKKKSLRVTIMFWCALKLSMCILMNVILMKTTWEERVKQESFITFITQLTLNNSAELLTTT